MALSLSMLMSELTTIPSRSGAPERFQFHRSRLDYCRTRRWDYIRRADLLICVKGGMQAERKGWGDVLLVRKEAAEGPYNDREV